MSDLLSLLREHDLPPKWDGLAVLWKGWEYVPPTSMTMFHSSGRDVCEGCGMLTTERGFPCWSANRGLVAVSMVITHADLRYEDLSPQTIAAAKTFIMDGVAVVRAISSAIRFTETRVCCQASKTWDNCWIGAKNRSM